MIEKIFKDQKIQLYLYYLYACQNSDQLQRTILCMIRCFDQISTINLNLKNFFIKRKSRVVVAVLIIRAKGSNNSLKFWLASNFGHCETKLLLN